MIVLEEIGFDFELGRKDDDWAEWEQIAEAAIGEHWHGNDPWRSVDAP